MNGPVRTQDDRGFWYNMPCHCLSESVQTLSFKGRRSRNKVSVGEPAEGSLTIYSFAVFSNMYFYICLGYSQTPVLKLKSIFIYNNQNYIIIIISMYL